MLWKYIDGDRTHFIATWFVACALNIQGYMPRYTGKTRGHTLPTYQVPNFISG